MGKHSTSSQPQIEVSGKREPALLPSGELREFTNVQRHKFFVRDQSLDGFDGSTLEQRLYKRFDDGQKRIIWEEGAVIEHMKSAIRAEPNPISVGWLEALQIRIARAFDFVNAIAGDPEQFATLIRSGLAELDKVLVGNADGWEAKRGQVEGRIEREAERIAASALQAQITTLDAEASAYSDERLRGYFQSILDRLRKTIPSNLKTETVIDKPAQTESIALPAIGNGLLDQVIRTAQMECSDPFLTAEVFLRLRAMAEVKTRPFIGVTSEGLQWTDGNDSPRYLSKRNLSERLNRQKVRARAREMSR